jgi:predicted RNase H-like HicB family nuclease
MINLRKSFSKYNHMQFTVYIEQDESGKYIGSIPSVPSCYSEGETKDELMQNLAEVLRLCLRNIDKSNFPKTKFIGVENLELPNA